MLLYLYSIKTNLTFKKAERLKSRKVIEQLFSNGKSFTVYPLKALYQLNDATDGPGLQTGVAVSKRNFKKAVDRNRIKRLLRESCRLQKMEIENTLTNSSKQLALFIIYTGKEMPVFEEVMEKVKTIFNGMIAAINKNK